MNDILRTDNYFATPIWSIQKPEWVEKINNACDKHINFAKKNLKKQIKERELFLEIVSTTSGGVNPKQNLEIALGVMSDVLAGRPIRMGFKTSQSLDVLLKDKDSKINSPKFRNYTDTFKYFAGTDDRLPNTTNDLQMAKIFGMNPETLANNPDLYALMTMTLNNLAENVNIKDHLGSLVAKHSASITELNTANIKDSAVNACSPPDNKVMD